jgi:thioredoxin-related protein
MMRLARALPFLIVVLLGLAPLPAGAEARIVWRRWDDGLQEARRAGKPVLVDVFTDWCGWCKRMDRDVYSRADVREYLTAHFVTVKLDAESDEGARYEGRDLTSSMIAERFRVTSYPTTVFLGPSGQHIINVPGYVPPDRFLLVLRYIGERQLERGVSWDTFLRQNVSGR